MIQGIQIEMTSKQLREHIEARVGYHAEKMKWYSAQVTSLKSGGMEDTNHSNNPIGSLVSSAKGHGEKAAFFRVLADHLVANETYRLSEQDLTRLEFVSRYM